MENELGYSCYLCKREHFFLRPGSVRDNKNIDVLECTNCGLVCLSSLNHIEIDHYQNSGMHGNIKPDIESWVKTTQVDDERRFNFVKEQIVNKKVLDFGCGTGSFLNLAKASAKEVAGIELDRALQPFFEENGINVFLNLKEATKEDQKWDVITAFHVVEHLSDPKNTLAELACLLSDEGILIIEVPNSNDALLTLYNNEGFQNFSYW